MILTKQDPVWLQAKLAHRVFAGILREHGKAVSAHPVILASALTSYPSSAYVYTNGDLYTAEPSNGVSKNFPGGGSYDDAYKYYTDNGYFNLCGPGATDVALFDWPWPPNDANYANVYDPLSGQHPTASTSWNGTDVDGTTRTRGYLIHLAFSLTNKPPTWSATGMMQQSTYLLHTYDSSQYPLANGNYGVMLQVVQDAANWEASGENSSNWSSYFYTTQWNSAYYNGNHNIYPANLYSALHSDIVSDIAGSGVPVIAEVDTSYLPNWVSGGVNHFIAIVGYDDSQGKYYYIDTCKAYTNCNGGGQDTPDLHPISQTQLGEAVNAIGTNQLTGDGGWVW